MIQLRLTREEWRHLSRLAYLRRMTVEDLVREGLRLSAPDSSPGRPREPKLRAIAPDSTA